MYTMFCAVNLQVTEREKEASKEVGEEEKEKEALRVEREGIET
jgi:hypothetical protein